MHIDSFESFGYLYTLGCVDDPQRNSERFVMKLARPSFVALRPLIVGCMIFIGQANPARSASFDLIWDPSGVIAHVSPRSLSADGSTFVGEAIGSSGQSAFIWNAERGLRSLGDLPGGLAFSNALGVSRDGSFVTGISGSSSGSVAFIWDENRGMRELGPLPQGIATTLASGISDDGSTVVGTMYSADLRRSEAFYWNDAVGYRGLGPLPDGTTPYGGAGSASSDGSVVVGGASNQAFFWTESDGMVLLGDLRPTPGPPNSVAMDITGDGSIIVGRAYGPTGFIWDAARGMRSFGTLPPEIYNSAPFSVSDDASVVVGQASTAMGSEAMIWTPSGGTQILRVVLATLGVDLDGWTLFDATSVSADGRTIVGNATKRGFGTRAFIAIIPEPGTGVLLLLGLSGLAASRRFGSTVKSARHTEP
jgi:uncharacterized membrane protein